MHGRQVDLVGAYAGDGLLNKLERVVDRLEVLPNGLAHARAIDAAFGHVVADELPTRQRIGRESLSNQLIQIEHLYALVAEHLGKAVVLCLGGLQKRDVIEEQASDIVRREVEQLVTRPVEHDLAKLAYLRANVEARCHSTLRNALVSIFWPYRRYPMNGR